MYFCYQARDESIESVDSQFGILGHGCLVRYILKILKITGLFVSH